MSWEQNQLTVNELKLKTGRPGLDQMEFGYAIRES